MTPQADLSQVPPQVRVALHIQFLYLQAQQNGLTMDKESLVGELFSSSCRVLTAYISAAVTPPPESPAPTFNPGKPMPKRDMWADGGPKAVPSQGSSGTAPAGT